MGSAMGIIMTYLVIASSSIDAVDDINIHVGKSLRESEELQKRTFYPMAWLASCLPWMCDLFYSTKTGWHGTTSPLNNAQHGQYVLYSLKQSCTVTFLQSKTSLLATLPLPVSTYPVCVIRFVRCRFNLQLHFVCVVRLPHVSSRGDLCFQNSFIMSWS